MLRLSLLSATDGRFLARVIDRDGFNFVLDFGDKAVIEDASQRVLHGFTMFRYGRLVNVVPQDPDLLLLLADHYAKEGLLVFLEEPTFDRERPGVRTDLLLQSLPEEDDLTDDADTELISAAEMDEYREPARRETWSPPQPLEQHLPDLPEEDAPTELLEEADLPTEVVAKPEA